MAHRFTEVKDHIQSVIYLEQQQQDSSIHQSCLAKLKTISQIWRFIRFHGPQIVLVFKLTGSLILFTASG